MITGNLMDFDKAEELGLLNHQFDAENEADFLEAILKYGSQFCAPNNASMAVGHIKRAVQTGLEVPLEAGLALERELQAKLFSSSDAKEGIAAFVEKRKPSFTGK
jgi:enoyl-CoA hydratase/carnithine racemase